MSKMVRSIGAQLGLLAFAIAILAGLCAGNTPTTILFRALLIMVAACLVGQAVGWIGKLVLRDHLQKKKLALDREHLESVRALQQKSQPPESTAPAEGG